MGHDVAESVLTPLRFLERSAQVWAQRPAVVSGERAFTYAEHHERIRRLAGALRELGVEPGDRVATLLPNVHAMLELHYAVPGIGAVLVPLNTRLTADDYAYIVEHSGARLVFADPELAELVEGPETITDHEPLIEEAEAVDLARPEDERALLSINYTSGTTGRPKGVMTTHRGAYLHSLGVIPEAGLTPRSSYLWTLPMFHCNGWAYTWAVTAAGAKHVCLPKVEAAPIWRALTSEGVTHLCAAPTVLTTIVSAQEAAPLDEPAHVFVGGAPPAPALLEKAAALNLHVTHLCAAPTVLTTIVSAQEAAPLDEPAHVFVGGAPPAPALLEEAAALNLHVTHLYGLTETYGPIAVCAWNPDWDELPADEQAALRARQGVGTIVSERMRVVDSDLNDVPADGETLGEVCMRGDNVMTGYYRDEEATAEAFKGGWFHSGDLGVVHPDGYVELRDRLKDVIISGGENIATIEVEQALAAHPSVSEVAVVAAPDERWGEVPVAFVTAAGGESPEQEELREFARGRLARFKVPKRIEVVDELPKTGTGKIQKFVLRERVG
jgi:fatty-acyl-CoA synthase